MALVTAVSGSLHIVEYMAPVGPHALCQRGLDQFNHTPEKCSSASAPVELHPIRLFVPADDEPCASPEVDRRWAGRAVPQQFDASSRRRRAGPEPRAGFRRRGLLQRAAVASTEADVDLGSWWGG
jgi:hypothetical protein